MSIKSLTTAVAASVLAGCTSLSSGGGRSCAVPEGLPTVGDEYEISVGDVIAINVFGQEELKGEYIVGSDGTISFPILGEIGAADRTLTTFVDEISTKLDADVVLNPRVNAQVIDHSPIYVFGSVLKPGSYSFNVYTGVYSAVAAAGGFTYRAKKDCVVLRRATTGEEFLIPTESDVILSPGDVIEVKARYF
ncbi:MAG: polysaccharide biosynthesis/export family protein [Pseudomonadota bacterium]